jgi:hypothetical protein
VLEAAHALDGPNMFDGYDCINWNVFDTMPKATPLKTTPVAPLDPQTDDPQTPPPVTTTNPFAPTPKQRDAFLGLYNRKRAKITPELDARIHEKVLSKTSISNFIGILSQL